MSSSGKEPSKAGVASSSDGGSQLFVPYRAAGVITTDVPMVLDMNTNYAADEGQRTFYYISSVGRSLQRYNRVLAVAGISEPAPKKIRCIANQGRIQFVGAGSDIHVYYNADKRIDALKGHSGRVTLLEAMGKYLLSYGTDRKIILWDMSSFGKTRDESMGKVLAKRNADLAPDFLVKQLKEEKEAEVIVKMEDEPKPKTAAKLKSQKQPQNRKRAHELVEEDDGESAGQIDSDEEAERDIQAVDSEEVTIQTTGPGRPSSSSSSSSPYFLHEIQLQEQVTCMIHPQTYLNKVLVGCQDGSLLLINIRSGKTLYRFKSISANGASVTCLAQAPGALDFVAVGMSDGRIEMLQLRYDKVHFSFLQTRAKSTGVSLSSGSGSAYSSAISSSKHVHQPVAVTALAFRTDGDECLASAGADGCIAVWDLQTKSLRSTIESAHDAAITTLMYLPNEPVLITAGRDNAIREFMFDVSDGTGRETRFRSGHSGYVTRVRFYNTLSHHVAPDVRPLDLVSTSLDGSLRSMLIHRSVGSRQLHSRVTIPLPPVIGMAAAEQRERDWANMVTIHADHANAYLWKYKVLARERQIVLSPPKEFGGRSWMTSVCVSACGNFVLCGTSSGHIHIFNMQSGLYRGTLGAKADAATGKPSTVHTGAVCGVYVDLLNTQVFSIASSDSKLKVWDWNSKLLVDEADLGSGVAPIQLTASPQTGLLAVSCTDFTIRVFDTATLRLVRHFRGHSNRLSDMVFSSDGRLLISASADSTIRTWDISSARCIDRFFTDKAPVSVSMDHSGQFLATSHAGSNAIYLWTNKLRFGKVYLRSVAEMVENAEESASSARKQQLPSSSSAPMSVDDSDDEAEVDVEEDSAAAETVKSESGPAVSSSSSSSSSSSKKSALVTLSGLPRPKWTVLANLDLIRQRNKPSQAPQKVQLPFFLPTVSGLGSVTSFVEPSEEEKALQLEAKSLTMSMPVGSRLESSGALIFESPFMQQMHMCKTKGDYTSIMEKLKKMTPSSIDLEIRMLSFDNNSAQVRLWLEFLGNRLKTGQDFEFLQSMLHVVLKLHGDTILLLGPELAAPLEEIRTALGASWSRVEALFHHSLCLVRFFSQVAI